MNKIPTEIRLMETDAIKMSRNEFLREHGLGLDEFYDAVRDYDDQLTHTFGTVEDHFTFVMKTFDELVRGKDWCPYTAADAEETEWKIKELHLNAEVV